ncbi:Caspase-6 [Rhynchospora pubera]|uniref:Caspase-6 n=1 Tax=Rhynchospora pubera TaxID=906938 RepID=A0AAV8H9L6_9POAL|nr:Caspase-6 [Rhynchospora pubera]
MAFRGSISRSLLTTARSLRSPPSTAARLRPAPPPSAPRLPTRRLSSIPSRNLGALVGAQALLLPLDCGVKAGPHLTSYLSASARAFCELSQGNGKDG